MGFDSTGQSSVAFAAQASPAREPRPEIVRVLPRVPAPRDSAPNPLIWAEKCASAAALAVLAPALAGVCLTVRLLSGKSPVVAHRRAGLGGEPFWLYKIRTMWDGNSTAASPGLIEYLQ